MNQILNITVYLNISFLTFICGNSFLLNSQTLECDRFYILELRDSIDVTGNNVYFTMTTDTNEYNTGYTDMFFVDQNSDTLNIYGAWGFWFPSIKNTPNDTVKYLIPYRSGITSFPQNFDGYLVTRNPECEIPYSNIKTGIDAESIDILEFQVFPNPSNGILNIRINEPGPGRIDIFDIYGSRILHKTYFKSLSQRIDLPSDLSAGHYFIRIISENKEGREDFLLVK